MKKAISTLLAFILAVSCMSTAAFAASDIHITVGGEPIAWTGAGPVAGANSRILVPLTIGSAMGLEVEWSSGSSAASFTRTAGGVTKTLRFPIGSKTAVYEIVGTDGETQTGEIGMDTAAVMENEDVYVPVRTLAEFFGYAVNWNGQSQTVVIREAGSYYATVGHWNATPMELGLSIMAYDPATGALELLNTVDPEVISGSQCVHPEKNVIYVCDEKESQDDTIGGGGYILAYSLDPLTGETTLLDRVDSFGVAPSYVTVDRTGQYLLAVNHAKENHTTKVVEQADGSFTVDVVFDDATVVAYRLNDDGSIGSVTDVSITEGDGPSAKTHIYSHLHSITQSPSGDLFFVCDKGTDKVYTYRLDRATGKLDQLHEYDVEAGAAPRYSVFHPTLPYVFQNLENLTSVKTWKYDETTGTLELAATTPLFTAEEIEALADTGISETGALSFGPSDIILSADGAHMYCSVRKANKLVVLDVSGDGALAVTQVLDSEGTNPRGLTLSPDGRFLFCINMQSHDIARFLVNDDGTLTFDAVAAQDMNLPANMIIRAY